MPATERWRQAHWRCPLTTPVYSEQSDHTVGHCRISSTLSSHPQPAAAAAAGHPTWVEVRPQCTHSRGTTPTSSTATVHGCSYATVELPARRRRRLRDLRRTVLTSHPAGRETSRTLSGRTADSRTAEGRPSRRSRSALGRPPDTGREAARWDGPETWNIR